MNEEDLSKSDLIEIMKRYRKWNAELTVERDEARAKLAAWDGLKRQEANEAEQRGYRKGVEDVRNVMRYSSAGMTVEQHAVILALLDKPELSEPPHNESISGMAHKPE